MSDCLKKNPGFGGWRAPQRDLPVHTHENTMLPEQAAHREAHGVLYAVYQHESTLR